MYSRTNSFKYSYFIRIIDEWNSLPNDIKETVGVSSFNPIQTGGGGGLFEPPLRQNRDNFYTERAMTFKFSDFS